MDIHSGSKSENEERKVPIVSFLSGKGGVGKTTFAANFARKLSKHHKILLIDCDLANRGATSLLSPEVKNEESNLYGLLQQGLRGQYINDQEFFRKVEDHNLKKLHENFYFLPSTLTNELIDWIDYKVETKRLKDVIENIINGFVKKYGLECVILDCKPGPDPLSGAVSALSTFSILLTEADPVTYSGTLNLRFYLSEKYGVQENIYVIVNKVPEKFDIENLDSLYANKIKGILQIFNVLSYVPFEYEIFESFGEQEFVIDLFPHSVFANKISVLIADLFKRDYPYLISPDIMQINERETDKIRRTIKPVAESRRSFRYLMMATMLISIGLLLVLIPMLRNLDLVTIVGVLYIIMAVIIMAAFIGLKLRYIRF